MAPAASRTSKRFKAGAQVDNAKPEIAQRAQRRVVVGEEAIQPIHHRCGEGAVEPPPALVALKLSRRADIEPEPRRLDDGLGERRHIAHADIKALPRERMHDMRGIADQRQPIRHEASRELQIEREGLAQGRATRDVAKPRGRSAVASSDEESRIAGTP